MEINFDPVELCEKLKYSCFSYNINEKCRVSFLFDCQKKFETMLLFISELQDSKVISSYNKTADITREEIATIYSEVQHAKEKKNKISVDLEILLYWMLPFENKYFLKK